MEPLWEYQWEFVPYPYDGPPERSGFWMTDEEAEHWHPGKHERSRRLDETRRDRHAQPPVPMGGGSFGARYKEPPAVDTPLPPFTSPDLPMLRYWWSYPRYCSEKSIRVLILEIVRLRRQLGESGD